ncbi:MAG: SCO family protein [Pirellulales bacterium]|nr:SCO family protein [Pirellulales bacterium]
MRSNVRRQTFGGRVAAGLFVMVCAVAASPPSFAQRMEAAPDDLKNVGITEHPNAQIPLDLPFVDSSGKQVTLKDFFDGTRPVVLTMNYSNCPMLCSLQLNGLFEGLQGLEWDLGKNFQMVTVSIDPKELPERAALTRQKYLKIYGRPGVGDGWHMLTGNEANIRKLADTVGFGYSFVQQTGEFAHAAAAFILTPDGRVSRYLYGIQYDPQTLRLSLVEAADGKVGSTFDRFLLTCFHYDETKGRYGPAAVKIMRLGALVTVVLLGGALMMFWRGEARRSAHLGRSETTDDTPDRVSQDREDA